MCAKILARRENFSLARTIRSSFGRHMAPRSGLRRIGQKFGKCMKTLPCSHVGGSHWGHHHLLQLQSRPKDRQPYPLWLNIFFCVVLLFFARYQIKAMLTKILLYFLHLQSKPKDRHHQQRTPLGKYAVQTLCLHCITLNYVTVHPIGTKSDMIFGCSTSFDYAVLIQSSLLNKSVKRVKKSCFGSSWLKLGLQNKTKNF